MSKVTLHRYSDGRSVLTIDRSVSEKDAMELAERLAGMEPGAKVMVLDGEVIEHDYPIGEFNAIRVEHEPATCQCLSC